MPSVHSTRSKYHHQNSFWFPDSRLNTNNHSKAARCQRRSSLYDHHDRFLHCKRHLASLEQYRQRSRTDCANETGNVACWWLCPMERKFKICSQPRYTKAHRLTGICSGTYSIIQTSLSFPPRRPLTRPTSFQAFSMSSPTGTALQRSKYHLWNFAIGFEMFSSCYWQVNLIASLLGSPSPRTQPLVFQPWLPILEVLSTTTVLSLTVLMTLVLQSIKSINKMDLLWWSIDLCVCALRLSCFRSSWESSGGIRLYKVGG